MENHICGRCNVGFETLNAYLEHVCEKTGYTPRGPGYKPEEPKKEQAAVPSFLDTDGSSSPQVPQKNIPQDARWQEEKKTPVVIEQNVTANLDMEKKEESKDPVDATLNNDGDTLVL